MVSDLQCPARFVLVHADGRPAGAGTPLAPGTDPLTQLEDLADLHRGESLVIRVPAEVVGALPRRLRPAPDAPVRVEVDADGWRPYAE